MKNVAKTIGRAILQRKKRENIKQRGRDKGERLDIKDLHRRQKNYTKEMLKLQFLNLRELKEDWERGPLAPRRESGSNIKQYGFVSDALVFTPDSHKQQETFAEKQYQKGTLRNLFAADDRVAIIRGPHKGTIKTIDRINYQSHTATLQNFNTYSYLPDEGIAREGGWPKSMIGDIQRQQIPFPLEDLRLVHRVGDQDVIVDRMEIHDSKWDKDRKAELPILRFIPSTNIQIPTPEPPPEEEPFKDVSKLGTLNHRVEEQSYSPTLSAPPFADSIINELRQKHGKYRIRYPDSHFNKLTRLEEQEQIMKDAAKLMRTPVQELAAKEARILKENTPKEPSEETLAQLGKTMLKNMKIDSAGDKPRKLNLRL